MNKTVAEIMTADPITVSPKTSLQEAIQILAEKKIRRLPVVNDESKLIGIITQGDVIKMMAAE